MKTLGRSNSSGPPHETSSPQQIEGALGKEKDTISNISLFDIYKDSSASPQESPMMLKGVLDRGSKENLFVEEGPSDFRDNVEKKKRKKKLLGRSKSEKRARKDSSGKSHDHEHESTGSPPTLSPERTSRGKKEGKKKKEKHSAAEQELAKELVVSKTTCADYANQLETKTLELKQALQREAFLIRELKEVRHEMENKVKNHISKYSGTSE